ncbi:hypothetical protein AXG93_4118s1170 [Marchantia polymorpha subsp. ruderalis]|uniref:Uncharacterized protein n=1 Tax=Marchantia polymorpha subsp. ruderalis TaxID=1480154 RepID=A0A176W3C3_MARPO|nr:hypothetical protein AXG93_4118s1170 [Marchantia polymorpha subsp. ruderalis]
MAASQVRTTDFCRTRNTIDKAISLWKESSADPPQRHWLQVANVLQNAIAMSIVTRIERWLKSTLARTEGSEGGSEALCTERAAIGLSRTGLPEGGTVDVRVNSTTWHMTPNPRRELHPGRIHASKNDKGVWKVTADTADSQVLGTRQVRMNEAQQGPLALIQEQIRVRADIRIPGSLEPSVRSGTLDKKRTTAKIGADDRGAENTPRDTLRVLGLRALNFRRNKRAQQPPKFAVRVPRAAHL